MKNISLITVLVLSQLGVSIARADLACEKKHQQVLMEFQTVAKTVDDPDIVKILLQGKDSGIRITDIAMDKARMDHATAAMKAKLPQINALLAKANCTTSIAQIETIKNAFKTSDFETAALALNAMRGLNGLVKMEEQTIAKMSTPTAPPPNHDVVDNGDGSDDNGDDNGDSEVVHAPQPHSYSRVQREWPVQLAADGLPMIDRAHPVVPKKGGFHYSTKDFGVITPPARGLTHFQWQQIFLGRATCVDGNFVMN